MQTVKKKASRYLKIDIIHVSFSFQGKIKYRETVYDGFEKMPEAFIGLFSGNNIGKAVVKA